MKLWSPSPARPDLHVDWPGREALTLLGLAGTQGEVGTPHRSLVAAAPSTSRVLVQSDGQSEAETRVRKLAAILIVD